MAKHVVKWKRRPEKDDIRAALRYLTLLFPDGYAKSIARRASSAKSIHYVAKDLLRASRLSLLPPDERHVAQDLKRIRKGKPLSPLIAVQGDLTMGRPFVVADGFHRMCAACHADEDSPVSVALVRPSSR
jgi:hypothetical protein